ncbi:hypothetical protein TNCV_2198931 [Trichonephila clavipes]|nr:hypothetical protein TNCV_2198931 [Trichonephila clavipes]
MVCSTIGYMSQSPLVHIDSTLNCASYICGMLRRDDLPFFRVVKCSAAALACMLTRSLAYRKCLIHGEFIHSQRLAYHSTPVTTVDELWHCIEAAWTSLLMHAIQSLFDSMPRCISAVTTVRGRSGY